MRGPVKGGGNWRGRRARGVSSDFGIGGTAHAAPEVAAISPRLLVAVFALLVVVVVANNSAGALAQPAIGDAFGAGPADVGWIVFGFSTTFAIGTAIWGGLARRFGLGPCLAAGVGLFAAGSALAVIAPSLAVVIAARVLQGMGAGAIPTLSVAAVSLEFEGHDRARALGTIIAAVGLGLAAGPILGGLALELFGWRGPLSFGIVAAPAVLVLGRVGGGPRPGAGLDVLGAGLVTVAVGAAMFSLNRLPITGLGTATIASLALLAVGGAWLIARSARANAFVPRRIVGAPGFGRLVFLGALGMFAFFGALVLIPVAVARVHALGGIGLGLVLVPMAVLGAVVSRQNDVFQARLGRRATTRLSLAAMAVGCLLVAAVGPGAPPPLLTLVLLPIGVAFGLLQAPLVNEVSELFPDADRPIALGLYNLAFFLGGAAGGAVATALVQARTELPLFAGRPLPGFSTTLVVLAAAPLLALLGELIRRSPRIGVPNGGAGG